MFEWRSSLSGRTQGGLWQSRYSKLIKVAIMHVTICKTEEDHEPHIMAPPSIQMPINHVTGNQDKQNIDDYIEQFRIVEWCGMMQLNRQDWSGKF